MRAFPLQTVSRNIAYIMAKHADPSIPDSPEEWLDEFSTSSIYQVLPKIIELWGLNVQTDVESKKNFTQQIGRWPHPCFCFAAYSSASPSGILTYSQSGWWTICTQKAAMMSTRAMHRSLHRGISIYFNRKFTAHRMTLYWRDTSMWVYCKPCGDFAYVSNKSEKRISWWKKHALQMRYLHQSLPHISMK